MAVNYANFQALAERLIFENGRTASLVKNTVIGGDEWAPVLDPSATTVRVFDAGITTEDQFNDLIGRTLIPKTGHRLLVSTSAGVVPEKRDTIIMDGAEYEIDMAETFSPAGTDIYYEIMIVT